jgi:RNA 3'-terminal phosphate cyclase (ATP)
MGLRISVQMVRPGFYPRGGGHVEARIEPCPGLKGLELLERGPIKLSGFSAVAGLPENIAVRQARRATTTLRQRHGLEAQIATETWTGGPGTVLGVLVETTPVPVLLFGLGERGKPAEKVADEALDQVGAFLNVSAAVDAHSADQLLLPLALAAGPSDFTVAEVTQHLLTNAAIVRQFVDREIVCEGEEGQPGRVRIS